MKRVIAFFMCCCSVAVTASELVHDFKSPAFSGIGYSSHVLTIEQLEAQRKQKLKDEAAAAAEKAERARQSTNAYKFQNNLESRIYAQLSKQIADALFGETPVDNVTDPTDWTISETPFGDQIHWQRYNDMINVRVYDSNNVLIADFSVPVGEFAF
jgi:coenzyme F420-reducing hydrogenase alpha subunit